MKGREGIKARKKSAERKGWKDREVERKLEGRQKSKEKRREIGEASGEDG